MVGLGAHKIDKCCYWSQYEPARNLNLRIVLGVFVFFRYFLDKRYTEVKTIMNIFISFLHVFIKKEHTSQRRLEVKIPPFCIEVQNSKCVKWGRSYAFYSAVSCLSFFKGVHERVV